MKGAFAYIQAQPDVTMVNTTKDYRVYQISRTETAAEILSNTKYFYFIDKYGLQWEFEQGHTDIGD